MPEDKLMRIFLADDHPLLRIGLRLSLSQEKDIEIIGEASDGFSAVEKIQADPPDVALIDVDMPGMSGIGAIRILCKAIPEMKILVLSTYNDEKYIRDAMQAGADGYVLKSVGISELVKIIKCFSEGQPIVSPYLVNLTLGLEAGQNDLGKEKNPRLTLREKEILKGIAEGKGNKEISDCLSISLETVKSHTKNIYKKLNVKNRVEAAMMAMERNHVF
jgi:DNA-binding NarL/FixJ family response regulator